MRGGSKFAIVLAVTALLVTNLAACGGGGSDDSTTGSTAVATPQSTATTTEGRGSAGGEKKAGNHKGGSGKSADGSSENGSSADERSASFRTPGGDNSIQDFGAEADSAEIDEATAALSAYLQARAKDDWGKECAYLAKAAVAPLEQLASRSSQLKGKDCAAILAALTGSAPTSTRASTLTGPVGSLRVEGERGFALYHGAHSADYFVPMIKEDGKWKVGAIAPSEFP
jgi:hypothetical protein